MHTLKLYHRADPDRALDTRTLAHGDLAIGRDGNAGWVVPDPTGQVSRLHCILAAADGKLTLQDMSANGVFIGEERARAANGERVPLRDREKLYFGQFLLEVAPAVEEPGRQAQIGVAPSLFRSAVLDTGELAIPADWTAIYDEPERPHAETAGAAAGPAPSPAFAAFCTGAKLDQRAFEGEDETEVMRRAGAVYKACMIGLSCLMNERGAVKADCGIDQTRLRPAENNPFKFLATRGLGVDVLSHHKRGFVTGAEAVKSAFVDVKKHLIAMLAGSRGVLTEALDALSPERVQRGLRGEAFFFGGKDGAAWKEYEKAYAAFRLEVLTNPQGSIDAAFRAAYERQHRELTEANDPCQPEPKA